MSTQYDFPDENGHYGSFGGRFVPETLMAALGELEEEYDKIREDESYQAELKLLAKDYVGRPTPLYYAENLTKKTGGAKILFKSEHLNHTGSHKVTNCLFQTLLAIRMKKTKLICESGAGAHYSAAAAVASKFSVPLIGVMGDIDVKRVNTNIIKAVSYTHLTLPTNREV